MENWNKLCYYLSEKIQTDIPEIEFEPVVEKGLEILGWDEFSGDFEIRPNYQLGSTRNSLRPDFVVKSRETGEKLFVVEIKRPQAPLSSQNQTQLSTYMRQFKLDFGILIGPQIQIFYDGNLNRKENATLIDNIEFKRENKKGIRFVELFSKETFDKDKLYEFAKKSFEKINERKTERSLKKEILSNDFKEIIWDLIIKKLSTQYDINLVSKVVEQVELNISDKDSEIYQDERVPLNHKNQRENHPNDILPIQLNPNSEEEFKEKLLLSKTAYITIFYKDGSSKQKVWNANRFNKKSHLLGNIRSRPDFRNGNWQKLKIQKVLVSIRKLTRF